MKKTILLVAVLIPLVIPGLLFGDEIVIKGPQGGTYAQGMDMTIQWDYTILSVPIPTNPIHRRVFFKIDSPSNPPGILFTYDFMADITDQSYTWKVNKPPGTYVVYFLVNFTNPPLRVTSQPFVIDAGSVTQQVDPAPIYTAEVKPPPPINVEILMPLKTPPSSLKISKKAQAVALAEWIQISSPQTGKSYYIGGKVPIQWSKAKIEKYGFVWLQICYPNGQPAAGACTTPNTGSYDWNVKENSKGTYRIKIWTHDKKYQGMSGVFHIKKLILKKSSENLIKKNRKVMRRGHPTSEILKQPHRVKK